MNKAELIDAIVAKTEMSKKDAEVALTAVVDAIKDALKAGEKVQLVGFGTFSVKEREQVVYVCAVACTFKFIHYICLPSQPQGADQARQKEFRA